MKNKKMLVILTFIIILNISLVLPVNYINYRLQEQNNSENIGSLLSTSNAIVYKWNYTWGDIDSEYVWDIVLDSSDNIYLAGYTNGTVAGDEDMCLVKFNNLGEYQWNRTWGGSGDEWGQAIALDSSNNIYLAGTWDADGPNPDMCLVKFNNLGEYQWNRTWGGSDWEECIGIELDSSGNIYLGGSQATTGGKYEEFCLVKFNSSGQYEWNRTWGGNQDDNAHAMAMDSSENIYLAGYTWNEFYISDAGLVKFNNLGDYQWNSTWGNVYDDEHPYGIAFDSLGNIYITGLITNESMTISDNFLVKYDSTGIYQWNHTWGGDGYDYAMAITSDSLDNIYIAGAAYSITKDMEMLLIQYDTSGVKQWNHTWGGNEADIYTTIALDSSDNLYLAGVTFSYGAGNVDMCLVKYDNIIPEINIKTPENKTYAGPMSGYYPATYGFDNEIVGTTGTNISFVNIWNGAPTSASIESEIGGHKNVLREEYSGGTHGDIYHIFDNNHSSGYCEFWFRCGNPITISQFLFMEGSLAGPHPQVKDGYFNYYDGSEHNLIPCNPDQWYHLAFEWYSNSTFDWYINGTKILEGGSNSNNLANGPDRIRLTAYAITTNYYDAFGFSWDPNYNVGDNLNEGLLLGFEKNSFDWIGYSLDGQNNLTIIGNTTISMPADGFHTIQIFGNVSSGVMYQSDMRYFSVDTKAPISYITFIPHSGFNIVNKTTIFTLNADDGLGSGVSVIRYRINNSDWIDYTNKFNLSSYVYGDYLISYQAIDLVDNIENENTLIVRLVEITSKPSRPAVPGYNILLFIGIISLISIFLIKKQKKPINNF